MSFWDEFFDKTKSGAQKVQEFTLDTVDKVKLKTKIVKLKNDVTKCYTEIGKLVYLERYSDTVENFSEKLSELFDRVTNLKEEIHECENQLEEI